MPKGNLSVFGHTFHHVYKYLFFSLVLLLLIYPLLSQVIFWKTLFLVFILITLFASIMATSAKWRNLIFLLPIAGLMFFSNWASEFYANTWLSLLGTASGIVFFSYVIIAMLDDVFVHHKQVTSEMIYGAVSIYLLIGLLFAFVFSFIFQITPNAFHLSPNDLTYGFHSVDTFIYYSFVTLTTLGYGDITPKSQSAMATAYMVAVMGQIYLTVMVARIVGMYISQRDLREKS